MQIIDGQEMARKIRLSLASRVERHSSRPTLAVVLVGKNPASEIYVRNKEKACRECGFRSREHRLEETLGEGDLVRLIGQLNEDRETNGILLQLPLPGHMDEKKIILALDPSKDVDCFHPMNVGRLFSSRNNADLEILPCTAAGCLRMIKSVCPQLAGKNAVVLGRSNLVGRPVAQLLLNEDCSVTLVHSRTRDLPSLTKNAEIVVVAIGKPKFLKRAMLGNGVLVIDVGINRLSDGSICGDVDFDDVKDVCSFLSPVPGGVGPMTVACLMENTYNLFLKQNPGLSEPAEAPRVGRL
ncbi:MAG: bifunctional 5,10-methylenetetrahydrofolate dehydrogenase/5,10-methenyltetrahydrofolate cyclohydrolase [Rickettsiales bacterium]|jgi:methylenetetrahydrofolate dehydrogenase (NADP+)/methenyltetrahydrofolate cyclohydrolase|nr:bifunctional 5,10-methylenetetrahydrofolate dehydrogenase/5,10-methenyltetrahydrofolate cyclohydrolase [Rickettsiales bacterium]